MDNNNCFGPLDAFKESVLVLKSELEEFSKDHGPGKEDKYNLKIIPHLCTLRKLNRQSREMGESKNAKIGQLNSKLVQLMEQCDNVTFEGQCLKHEVATAKNRLSPSKPRLDSQGDVEMRPETNGNDMSFFDIEKVGQLDHQTRLQLLENEEKKRKKLQARLEEVRSETDEIETICQGSEAQLNRLTPYIKQLIDKVDLGTGIKTEKKD